MIVQATLRKLGVVLGSINNLIVFRLNRLQRYLPVYVFVVIARNNGELSVGGHRIIVKELGT